MVWRNPNDRRHCFPPLPPCLPSREPCGENCNAQLQSAFLTLLPGEIRNEIYRYVFSGWSAIESMNAKHHPLSLLFSCHQINHEATNLAFSMYAFVLSPRIRTAYISMRIQMAHLSAHQRSSITTLAYDLSRTYLQRGSETANMLTNAILLLPSLRNFELHVRSGPKQSQDVHNNVQVFQEPDMQKLAVYRYASRWLDYSMLQRLVEGSTFAWQRGEKWRIEWPQLDSDYLSVIDDKDVYGNWERRLYMDPEAAESLRGVHMCVCGCGEVAWTAADLVQETGRIVHVDTHFYVPPDYPAGRAIKPGRLGVMLQPGTKPEGEEVEPGYQLSHDERTCFKSSDLVDEAFFERIRKRGFAFSPLWWKRFWNF